jgi:aminoglycoside phosphotransferase (APT) family kinase protein
VQIVVHDKNAMCTTQGELLALIDWGDAGWGDPALDFASMPIAAVEHARAGYDEVTSILRGDETFEHRMMWARLDGALGRLELDAKRTGKLREFLAIIK